MTDQRVSDRFVGRTAIVAGAGIGGLGAAYAEALVAGGARVVAADIRGPQAQATVEGIAAGGGEAMAAEVDVTDEAAVLAMVDATVERFGGVDILINNAAVMFRWRARCRRAPGGGGHPDQQRRGDVPMACSMSASAWRGWTS